MKYSSDKSTGNHTGLPSNMRTAGPDPP